MISHAAALPSQVLMPSTRWRKRWRLMRCGPLPEGSGLGGAPPGLSGRRPARSALASELARRRVRSEIMVEGHAPVDHGVLLPPRRPPGECDLRLQDLLEDRV